MRYEVVNLSMREENERREERGKSICTVTTVFQTHVCSEADGKVNYHLHVPHLQRISF